MHPIKYPKLKTDKELVLRGINLGLDGRILFRRVNKYSITRDGGGVWLDIDDYQKGQGS